MSYIKVELPQIFLAAIAAIFTVMQTILILVFWQGTQANVEMVKLQKQHVAAMQEYTQALKDIRQIQGSAVGLPAMSTTFILDGKNAVWLLPRKPGMTNQELIAALRSDLADFSQQ